MRVLFPGIEDHPVLRELEVMPVSLPSHPAGMQTHISQEVQMGPTD